MVSVELISTCPNLFKTILFFFVFVLVSIQVWVVSSQWSCELIRACPRSVSNSTHSFSSFRLKVMSNCPSSSTPKELVYFIFYCTGKQQWLLFFVNKTIMIFKHSPISYTHLTLLFFLSLSSYYINYLSHLSLFSFHFLYLIRCKMELRESFFIGKWCGFQSSGASQ